VSRHLLRPQIQPFIKTWIRSFYDLKFIDLNYLQLLFSRHGFVQLAPQTCLLRWQAAYHSSKLILLFCTHLQHTKLAPFQSNWRKLISGYSKLNVFTTYEGVRLIVLSVAIKTVFTKVMNFCFWQKTIKFGHCSWNELIE
jgi:hypothetical protein